MSNPKMANDQLKKDLKDILKIKGTVTRQRPVKGLLKKEAFIRFIENYKYSNDRTLLMKIEHGIDFVNFEEPFIQSIEALLELHFNKNQTRLSYLPVYLIVIKFTSINNPFYNPKLSNMNLRSATGTGRSGSYRLFEKR